MAAKAPNILLIMTDQLAPQALPAYGHTVVKTPNIDHLAENGVVFENCYCASPICAPARASLMTGQLPSSIGAWDNSSEFSSEIPTVAHYLRHSGYRTCLSGKMHFLGADQLHGFEERLTTDMCPADFHWTQDWDSPGCIKPYHHTLKNIAIAGVAERTLQQDFDNETSYQAVRWINNYACSHGERPFFLTVSFTHPHDPYVTSQRFWDRYEHDIIDLPTVPYIPPEKRDAHDFRLYEHFDRGEYEITESDIRTARHAYYGNISYLDEKIGEVLDTLRNTRLLDDTVVIFTGDHGDMLGERGLWYKMSFHEWSARVPLLLYGAEISVPSRVSSVCSLVDLLPTLIELTGNDPDNLLVEEVEGRSLLPLLSGSIKDWHDTAIGELYHDVVPAPYFMIRQGRYKYLQCKMYPPQLFDLERDPTELNNLSENPSHKKVAKSLSGELAKKIDADRIENRVLCSQRRRRLVYDALVRGRISAWDFQPFFDASKLYYRGIKSYHLAEERHMLRIK